ncbi:ABC transporter permease, partial [Psychrobacter sp. AOP7-A1-24]
MSQETNKSSTQSQANARKSSSASPMYKKDLFTHIATLSPKFLLLILILPVLGGLISVLLPAFSWVPALEQTTVSLQGFKDLWMTPGLTQMVLLSIGTGLISTLLSFVMTLMILAAFFNSVWLTRIEHLLSPILVIPHAAAAIAVGFLIAPSGMFARLISPWLSGWELAPEGIFPHDPYGISIILGLTLKELPFL